MSPTSPKMPNVRPSQAAEGYSRHCDRACHTLIVGAGITGLAVAYHLRRLGHGLLIVEKSETVGGIWASQKWPGIRCDTEVATYGLADFPIEAETPLIAGQKIAAYLRKVSETACLAGLIEFHTEVKRINFRSDLSLWEVETNRGSIAARIVVNANGYFADSPMMPPLLGKEHFAKPIHHLSELDGNATFPGQRLILIGSGAAAITAAPELARRSSHVTIVQRSPSYIYEDENRFGAISRFVNSATRRGHRVPLKLLRLIFRLKNDLIFLSFRKWPAFGRRIFYNHWKEDISDACMKRHFSPRYDPWEQRIPVSSGLKDALRDGRISFETGEIRDFCPDGAVLDNGQLVPADVVICATGFDLHLFKFEIQIDGRKVELAGINYFKGMMLGGVPNFFQPFGVVHSAWTPRIETVARLIAKIINYMDRNHHCTVEIDRKRCESRPKISPGYIMRSLKDLPASYGTYEIPTIDDLFCFRFWPSQYQFSGARYDPSDWLDERSGAGIR